ncbi:lysophospholipid acyltransferase family protein [Nakamurella multipartita]|uniref:Phospholipid/glycerol acyltransferase n=1 Tax=Nakamurella multipartita (strain ATCC 700099 / DSM 44233 / CIP 104796 / JCM 9543 / NBRC 105858 / Y-104) TaxID=479431 RepID=C8XEZ6_NAKMY|nr:lysophospholipid acyltransferase family protein [Nakamurella multipartita]ACV77882.1 phospholipid/glycerol acyltransferase [Nakamurella multipartita DSM 44233]HOZ57423.1 lysophospholipid acyltransferase family protein [Nakamurella multipartita]
MARSPVYEKGNAWLAFCKVVMYPLASLLGRQKVGGAEHARRRGGYLLVANHISHLDPLFDAVAVRKTGRIPRFMAKASLWKVPVLGKALAGSDQIPVDRTGAGAGQNSLEAATAALNAGRVVLIYPDGTVTRDPEMWPMKPRMGVGALALSGDFPVIPMAHWGSNQVYTSYVQGRRFHPWPRKDVHTVFGEPIDLSDLRAGARDARAVRAASVRIMTAVRDMVGEVRGITPPTEFYDQRKAERLAQRSAAADAEPPAAAAPPETPDR